jgi:GNAT superfamily N-acetyltransferase
LISGEYREKTPYLMLVKEDSKPYLVMMCTPPFPVICSYLEEIPNRTILQEVIQDLSRSLREDFRGITGCKDLTFRLVNLYQEEKGVQYKQIMAMRIYKLEKVIPVRGVSGVMRKAKPGDKDLIREWYTNFHRDGLGEEPEPDLVERQIQRYITADPQKRGLMFWEVDHKPVSMAGYAGPTPNGIRVGAVYTPQEHRRQGYASACTAALSQYLLDTGFKFCFLFTDLKNPTSNKIYQEIGYQAVSDVARYDFIVDPKADNTR